MSEARKPIDVLTPAWLRAQSTAGEWPQIPASACGVIADALEIADEAAECFVECETYSVKDGGADWCDLSRLESHSAESVLRNVAYLDSRGILIRHADKPHLLRFREQPE
jgi:hypothetical protein